MNNQIQKTNYLFGTEVAGLQSPPIRHAYMNEIVKYFFKNNSPKPIRFLEIGSWVGSSTITWTKSLLKLTSNVEVYCVDPWKPYFDTTLNTDKHYHLMNKIAANKQALNIFKHNIKLAKIEKLISYSQGTSRDILPNFASEYFDIVYIDGSHLLSDVQYDVSQAKRLIKEDGIICGDDLELQLHESNLDEHKIALNSNKDFVTDSLNRSYHPGVTQAVAEGFPSVSVFEGLWAIQRLKDGWTNISLPMQIQLETPKHIAAQPSFIEEYKGFNLFRYNTEICCIKQSLGRVEIYDKKQLLLSKFAPESLFFTEDINSARKNIDQLLKTQELSEGINQ